MCFVLTIKGRAKIKQHRIKMSEFLVPWEESKQKKKKKNIALTFALRLLEIQDVCVYMYNMSWHFYFFVELYF